ncbi:MAG: DUF1624 domain-containing protein [Phycisphaerales bacterium]|nr:DUF1624 domain-containing protein [Phycisphaerales bacterium]
MASDIEAGCGKRVPGVDAARGLAIAGMIWVHFGLVMHTDASTGSVLAWAYEAIAGRPAALFMLLAGVGIGLRLDAAADHPDALQTARSILARRGLFFLVLGFAFLAIWDGDILRVYGLSFLIAAAIAMWRPSAWLVASGVAMVIFVMLMGLLDYEAHWHWDTLEYRDLWTAAGLLRNTLFDGFRPLFPWIALLLFGMWLGRRAIRDATARRLALIVAVVVAVLVEVSSTVAVSSMIASGIEVELARAIVGQGSMPPMPPFLIASGAEATVVLLLLIKLEGTPIRSLLTPVRRFGQMAFTWYIGHIVLGVGGLVALGVTADYTLGAALIATLAFCAIASAASMLWLSRFRYGPLESLLRRMAG